MNYREYQRLADVLQQTHERSKLFSETLQPFVAQIQQRNAEMMRPLLASYTEAIERMTQPLAGMQAALDAATAFRLPDSFLKSMETSNLFAGIDFSRLQFQIPIPPLIDRFPHLPLPPNNARSKEKDLDTLIEEIADLFVDGELRQIVEVEEGGEFWGYEILMDIIEESPLAAFEIIVFLQRQVYKLAQEIVRLNQQETKRRLTEFLKKQIQDVGDDYNWPDDASPLPPSPN